MVHWWVLVHYGLDHQADLFTWLLFLMALIISKISTCLSSVHHMRYDNPDNLREYLGRNSGKSSCKIIEYIIRRQGYYYYKLITLPTKFWCISYIRKVFRVFEFDHIQGAIFKKPAKQYISIQLGIKLRKPSVLVVNWVSSCLSLFLSASTAATYIFTAPKLYNYYN
jgi:hypothetical protein